MQRPSPVRSTASNAVPDTKHEAIVYDFEGKLNEYGMRASYQIREWLARFRRPLATSAARLFIRVWYRQIALAMTPSSGLSMPITKMRLILFAASKITEV